MNFSFVINLRRERNRLYDQYMDSDYDGDFHQYLRLKGNRELMTHHLKEVVHSLLPSDTEVRYHI